MKTATPQGISVSLGRAYLEAVERGLGLVAVPVEMVADILQYLDHTDNNPAHIGKHLDDLSGEELRKKFSE